MKDVFLVHISLPDTFTKELYDLIPRQKELLNTLLERRVVLSYSLDMERKNMWVFFEVKDREELGQILSEFPAIRNIRVTIHEMAFYDSAPLPMPDPIMN
jgi:hypothetical protein